MTRRFILTEYFNKDIQYSEGYKDIKEDILFICGNKTVFVKNDENIPYLNGVIFLKKSYLPTIWGISVDKAKDQVSLLKVFDRFQVSITNDSKYMRFRFSFKKGKNHIGWTSSETNAMRYLFQFEDQIIKFANAYNVWDSSNLQNKFRILENIRSNISSEIKDDSKFIDYLNKFIKVNTKDIYKERDVIHAKLFDRLDFNC